MVFLNIACMPALKKLKDGSNVHISLHSPEDWLQFIAEIIDKSNKDIIVYVFFDVFNDKEELITQGFKIHRRINIVPLTRVDEETGNSLIGEE